MGLTDRDPAYPLGGAWLRFAISLPRSGGPLWILAVLGCGGVLGIAIARRRPQATAALTSTALLVFTCAGAPRHPSYFWVHTDPLGTPLAVSNTNDYGDAKVVWRAQYEPFGKATVDENPDGDQTSFRLNVRFQGQYFDAETGLHYNLARDYDPAAGNYVEYDPAGFSGGLNGYAYASGNPIVFSDPLGLATCVYSITEHTIECVSNDGSISIAAHEGIHSGFGPCRDATSCAGVKDLGPIPPDIYKVTANTLPGRAGWWALQSQSWTPGIDGLVCRMGLKRCGFNVHLGNFSEGCITFMKANSTAAANYQLINDLFLSDAPNNTLKVVPTLRAGSR